jgi:adenine phosphoribosyltransferase
MPHASDLARYVRDIPDWPTPGVLFRDITPLLADADAFARCVQALAETHGEHAGQPVDLVVGIEARGFILAAPVAHQLQAGFVPVRKHGKLPHETLSEAYTLEYGAAVLEIHADALPAGSRVLVVDDVLATGGTVAATAELVRRAGGTVVGVNVLIELAALGGRSRNPGLPIDAILTM